VTPAASTDATGLWRRIFGAPGAGLPDAAAARRLGELLSPALADHLLRPAAGDPPAWDGAFLRSSRLANRFARAQQLRWVKVIAEAGISAIYLMGFAAAHSVYADPNVRIIGDLDILVRAGDVDRLVDLLQGHGFAFSPAPRRAWGAIADGSFAPGVFPDGHCNIDIHRHPDSYPAHLSLGADLVFDASVEVTVGELKIRIPCREHALLLAISNAAKDKFGPFSVRQVVDAAVMLRDGPAPDWHKIADLAQRGGLSRPARVFLSLLVALGLPGDRVPAAFVSLPGGLRGREFDRLLESWRGLFPYRNSLLARLRREILLCAEPATGLRRNFARLNKLAWPRDGVPSRAAFI
jgi:hypothetical protein